MQWLQDSHGRSFEIKVTFIVIMRYVLNIQLKTDCSCSWCRTINAEDRTAML